MHAFEDELLLRVLQRRVDHTDEIEALLIFESNLDVVGLLTPPTHTSGYIATVHHNSTLFAR